MAQAQAQFVKTSNTAGPQDGRCVAALRSEPQCRVGPLTDVSTQAAPLQPCDVLDQLGNRDVGCSEPNWGHWAPESWPCLEPHGTHALQVHISGLPSGVRN